MPAEAEPTTIRTARGVYELTVSHQPMWPRRPWVVSLTMREGDGWVNVCGWWLLTEADARRVARALDLDVREGRIE